MMIHIMFAFFLFHVFFLLNSYFGKNIMSSSTSCGIFGAAVQYFFIAQFSCLHGHVLVLYLILIREKIFNGLNHLFFLLLNWGVPAIYFGLFYGCSYLILKYKNSGDTKLYGDLFLNGSFCFLMNFYSGIFGILVPCLCYIIVTTVLVIWIFIFRTKWQYKETILINRFNKSEFFNSFIFWILLIICWSLIGIFFALPKYWILILFEVLSLIIGFLCLVLYSFIPRNLCLLPPKDIKDFETSRNNSKYLEKEDSSSGFQKDIDDSSICNMDDLIVALNSVNIFEEKLQKKGFKNSDSKRISIADSRV